MTASVPVHKLGDARLFVVVRHTVFTVAVAAAAAALAGLLVPHHSPDGEADGRQDERDNKDVAHGSGPRIDAAGVAAGEPLTVRRGPEE